jgi:EAL domain-containing protein (putative c-di-GMP-specific phosphodiesterase class I)
MSALARASWGETRADESEPSLVGSGSHEVAIDQRVTRIRQAMQPGVMGIVFQPVVDLRRGIVAGAEALARFALEPKRTPDVWFNEAWDVDLGVDLEVAAIERALSALSDLPEGTHLAINASPETLVSPILDAALDAVPGHRLIIELTEHAQVDDYDNVKSAIDRLRARGIRLAIDDAGAGFSSLQHILHLRPDLIKLDRSLTTGIDSDPVRYALAAALVTFALSLGAEICAEGIEQDAELAALQHLGIAYGQGYLLGRPLPLPLASPPKGGWLRESGRAEVDRGARPTKGVLPYSLRAPPLRRSLRPAHLEVDLVPPELLDGAPDEAFDRVTRWVSRLLSVPMVSLSFVEQDREVIKSEVGLPREKPRGSTPCQHVVQWGRSVLIGDMRESPSRSPGLDAIGARAYAGVPVTGPDGRAIGTLSVMDTAPRTWTPDDERVLRELAAVLSSELELRARRRAPLLTGISFP